MPTPKKLRVLPNPHLTLDADGYPATAVPVMGVPGDFIGARLERVGDGADPASDASVSGEGSLEQRLSPPRRFVFTDGPVDVPAHAYYLAFLRTGELLPADERTAREAGVKFKDPTATLERNAELAAERFRGESGEWPAGFDVVAYAKRVTAAQAQASADKAKAKAEAEAKAKHDADERAKQKHAAEREADERKAAEAELAAARAAEAKAAEESAQAPAAPSTEADPNAPASADTDSNGGDA
jgi:hypothetical protein